MALNLATYPNPFDEANPFADAYAWIAGLSIDISKDAGKVVFNINPNADAWQSPPIAQVTFTLGQTLVSKGLGKADETFPRLDELMNDPEFAQAYSVIGSKLYAAALKSPAFKDATII